MLYYYIPFTLVWLSAFLAFVCRSDLSKFFFIVTTCIVFLFVVLRYQTGYDWNSYVDLYAKVKTIDILSFSDALFLSILSTKELLYVYVNALLKVIAEDYVIVQVASGSVLFYGLIKYLKYSTSQYAFVFAVTFSWLMFSLYFSVIRQGFAVGLFFLFLISQEKRKKKTSILIAVLAIGMQYSSAMYFLFYFLAKMEFVFRYRVWFWGLALLLLVFSFVGLDPAGALLSNIPLFGIGMLEEKMHWYLEERANTVDVSGLAFVSAYTVVIGFLLMRSSYYYYQKSIYKVAYNFAILFLPAQVFFINYSIFRNRLLYVAMALSLVIIVDYLGKMGLWMRLSSFFLAMLLSLSYFTLYLSSSSGVPFVPYQNVVGHYLFEYFSDGEVRLERYTTDHR